MIRKHWWRFMLGTVIVSLYAIAIPVALVKSQSDPADIAPESCSERYSAFENGVLIYECKLVDRQGTYVVVETARDGSVTERPATPQEIASYESATKEKECFAAKRSAQNELTTPIARVDVEFLATRVAAIEAILVPCENLSNG